MNKATITISSPIYGDETVTLENTHLAFLYATIVGTVQGALKSGNSITALTVEENLA